MAEFPALPLWTDAWVADTKHLTWLERGTYHDLLVLMWRSPGCRIPNDDHWLAKRLGMSLAEVQHELRPRASSNTGPSRSPYPLMPRMYSRSIIRMGDIPAWSSFHVTLNSRPSRQRLHDRSDTYHFSMYQRGKCGVSRCPRRDQRTRDAR